jgi:ATP-binding cassette subfamily C protein
MTAKQNEMVDAVRNLRPAIIAAFIIGFFSTVLSFVVPLYSLQIFERVATSRNLNTLIALTIIVVLLLLADTILSQLKSAMLQRAAVSLDRRIAGRLFEQVHRSIVSSDRTDSQAKLTDLDNVRSLIAGPVLTAITQVVYFPFFVVILWLFHPLFAGLVLMGLVLIVIFTLMGRHAAEQANTYANQAQASANDLSAALFRSYETVQALGMRRSLRNLWLGPHNDAMGWSMVATRKSSVFNMLLEATRGIMQVAVYGIAGYLIISGAITMGVMMAASIIVGRAFASVQSIIGGWRQIATARESYERLTALFEDDRTAPLPVQLPTPAGRLTLEGVSVAPPGKPLSAALLRGVSFDLPAGSILAIIGPSAAGKTTLLKAMVGVWKPAIGEVRIDGSTLAQWDDEVLGQHVGYLAAEVDLFPGSVADNIRRFTAASDDEVIAAAQRARVHEMIMQLPSGYAEKITSRGSGLSSGQRQRIGLARALFGNPRLIILDEPNANLDAQGEENLMQAIRAMRDEGRTVVFVTHKVSLVQVADYVLVLGGGGQKDFGPRDKVMHKMMEPRVAAGGVTRVG